MSCVDCGRKDADIIILDAKRAINTMGFLNVPGAVVTLMDTGNVKHVLAPSLRSTSSH